MDKKALHHMTYGMFLLTAQENERDNGCIINTALQVASEPTRISISVIRTNETCDMIRRTGLFNLSALSIDVEFSVIRHFGMQSGRDVDKFADTADVARSRNGLYYLTKQANMYLSAKVVEEMDLGSHILFIAEVVDGVRLSETPSCTYSYYQSDIKPKPQKSVRKQWVCSVCGYVYEGDTVPDDFICPLCGHGKEDFVLADGEYAPKTAPSSVPKGKRWVCSVCGYVYEGESAPDICPICKAPKEKFIEQGADRTWAAEHVVGVAKGAPEDIMTDLRANFEGECSEVGMYLAMARVAHREGYPEIGLYWEKAAYEEAEHAAKFAELLGEVVTDSTEKNLQMRVEAENGATAGKFDLAKRAKALNLDAIHDTVHEMARDEARHGKAFEGLLKRYFNK